MKRSPENFKASFIISACRPLTLISGNASLSIVIFTNSIGSEAHYAWFIEINGIEMNTKFHLLVLVVQNFFLLASNDHSNGKPNEAAAACRHVLCYAPFANASNRS